MGRDNASGNLRTPKKPKLDDWWAGAADALGYDLDARLREAVAQPDKRPLEEILTHSPVWFKPYLKPKRYKGLWSGRGGGKSHALAELMIARMAKEPDLKCVCIREIQKTLTYSAKLLLENKITSLGYGRLFSIQRSEIRRIGGSGVIIFVGMQDHNAESIKSLESFDIAWVEEAQSISQRSLKLLRPTLRSPGSELWFSWNPEQPEDAVDAFLRPEGRELDPERFLVTRVNWNMNSFITQTLLDEMEDDRATDTDYYLHVWEGEYNKKSKVQVFGGAWRIEEFTVQPSWDGPYYGADWGFSQDPTVAVRLWIDWAEDKDYKKRLYIEYDRADYDLALDEIARTWIEHIPGIFDHVVKADCSQPQTIKHVRSPGKKEDREYIPKLRAAKKWSGSVEDGIKYMKSFDIVIHPRCEQTIKEMKMYKFKENKAGEILRDIIDAHNHCVDSCRYSLGPLIEAHLGVLENVASEDDARDELLGVLG